MIIVRSRFEYITHVGCVCVSRRDNHIAPAAYFDGNTLDKL